MPPSRLGLDAVARIPTRLSPHPRPARTALPPTFGVRGAQALEKEELDRHPKSQAELDRKSHFFVRKRLNALADGDRIIYVDRFASPTDPGPGVGWVERGGCRGVESERLNATGSG